MTKTDLIDLIKREVVKELKLLSDNDYTAVSKKIVPIAVSARHVHLSKDKLSTLFGPGYQLTKKNDLYQPGEYAAEETVTLVGANLRPLPNVRILGPLREYTQVEISRTDAILLGIPAIVKISGDLKGAAPIALVGPVGSVTLQEGAIIANRHIHINTEDALKWDLRNGDEVVVQTTGADRPTTFSSVQIRVSSKYRLIMHMDTDDANAAGLKCGDEVEILS